MKKRNGFVTNSSSSSFVVEKRYLKKKQIKAIKNHIHYANARLGWHESVRDAWSIYEDEYLIQGNVLMDNFDMYEFMKAFKVDMDKVSFEF